jgi:hypothetical protein
MYTETAVESPRHESPKAARDGGMAPLQPHEMDYIRRVLNEEAKKHVEGSIATPREDAQMFRNIDKHSIPCECIVELYELLWRWGHRNTSRPSFAQNFGFSIPDTIVFAKGRPYAWYFISKKDGALLRKSEANLSTGFIEKKFCRARLDGETPICATWMPMASQFAEARCHTPYVEFLTVNACRHFLSGMRGSHSGVLQAFVDPHGVSNFLVRTVQYREQTSLCLRTNRSVIGSSIKGNPFDRTATFEGWPGLSSTSSRYRSHKHPHMEDEILVAGETLNGRIEQERVRQMLFLGPTQHVALHFKVARDQQLFFIYASVVSEKEVILQTRPQLLMGDPIMTVALPGAALLPGGTDMKALPYRGPPNGSGSMSARDMMYDDQMDEADRDYQLLLQCGQGGQGGFDSQQGGSLPPPRGRSDALDDAGARKRMLSERRRKQDLSNPDLSQYMPKVAYPRPAVPEAPYKIVDPPREEDALGRPSCSLDSLKKPLIFPVSARAILQPQSARGMVEIMARSGPGCFGEGSGRPPLAPETWSSGPV